jgi:hypothetical protein
MVLLTLIKLALIIIGTCLGLDFAFKGLIRKDKYLFYEGIVMLVLTILFILIF